MKGSWDNLGEPVPCCGCPLGRGPGAQVCGCRCHDAYKAWMAKGFPGDETAPNVPTAA